MLGETTTKRVAYWRATGIGRPAPTIAIINPVTTLTEPAIIHLRLDAPWPTSDAEGSASVSKLRSKRSSQSWSNWFPLVVARFSTNLPAFACSGRRRRRHHRATSTIDITIQYAWPSATVYHRTESELYTHNRRIHDIISCTSLYAYTHV